MDITNDTTENTKDLNYYYDKIYANKLHNLQEMDKFLET